MSQSTHHKPDTEERDVDVYLDPPPTSREGVDLTLIRELRAMTPTEKAKALAQAANALARLRRDVRRI